MGLFGQTDAPVRCGIALGGNVSDAFGDRLAHLRAAQAELAALHRGDEPPLFSPLYETEPVDCPPGSPAYLNAVAEIGWPGSPESVAGLFRRLQALEQAHGRPAAHGHHTPRPLDLDLLYAGDLQLPPPPQAGEASSQVGDTPLQSGQTSPLSEQGELILPHPRLHQRRFVLAPLADIRPALRLPGFTKTVAELLAALPVEPRAVRLPAPL